MYDPAAGLYHLWYLTHPGNVGDIRHATSTNGVNFGADEAFVLDPSWSSRYEGTAALPVYSIRVSRHPDGNWIMAIWHAWA